MIAEFSTLLSSSKAGIDIAKALASVYVDDKVRERTSELVRILSSVQLDALTVQVKYQELIKDKDDLEKKILNFENWSITERQYELKEIAAGIFVYAYKKSEENAEPNHWLCVKCYNEKNKSILQRVKHDGFGVHYICHSCSSVIIDHSNPKYFQQPQRQVLANGIE